WGCGYPVKLCPITCEPWMRRFLYTSESSPLSGRHCGDQELKSSVFWPEQNRPNLTDQVIMLRLMSAQRYGQEIYTRLGKSPPVRCIHAHRHHRNRRPHRRQTDRVSVSHSYPERGLPDRFEYPQAFFW